MESPISRAERALFDDSRVTTTNVKFFLGNRRDVTPEQLANELNRADAQVRAGIAKPDVRFDADLTSTKVL